MLFHTRGNISCPLRAFEILVFVGIWLLAGCAPSAEKEVIPPSPTPSPYELSLTEIPLEEANAYFQDPMSQQILAGIEHFTQSGFKSLHTLSRFGPSDQALTSGPYALLEPGDHLMGYILLVNTLEHPHDFLIVPVLNYLPVQVRWNGLSEVFPSFRLEPGAQMAFRFTLPPLPEGLHMLILTFLVDPNHHFVFHPELDPAEGEAISFHGAPLSWGVLIWVTTQKPRTPEDWPDEARAFPPEQTTLLMEAKLVKEPPVLGKPGPVFQNEDEALPGQRLPYYATFVTAPKSYARLPVKVLIFWDRYLSQTLDLDVPISEESATYGLTPISLPLEILVPEWLPEGTHFLTALAYPYPYYLRGWLGEGDWYPEVCPWSLPMARFPVEVRQAQPSSP